MTRVIVVAGAQFGSEGKGAICGHLGKQMRRQDVAIRVAGPNAGHTAYDSDHREWKLRAVPVAAVTSSDCQLHIAAGSEIDLSVLNAELALLDQAGHRATERLTIHPSATIIDQKHLGQESVSGLVGRIGSTGKGIGAARSARIWREANTAEAAFPMRMLSHPGPFDLDGIGTVVVEGTQGYGLGLHTQFYPQVTSSDCRAIDFLAMAGISPWAARELQVILVARVYPIRVAGNSGPLFGETSWEKLGLPEERTTVTHKIRRVGAWDHQLVLEAIRANGGGSYTPEVHLALTMLDQRIPAIRDQTKLTTEALVLVEGLEEQLETHITMVGTGPETVAQL